MKGTFRILLLLASALVLGLIAFLLMRITPPPYASVGSFEECVLAGYPVMESYPERCATPDGRVFVQQTTSQVPDESQHAAVHDGCSLSGCSGEICTEASEASNVVTTCIYKAQYACLRAATCERQTNGHCGWTNTPELRACIAGQASSSAQVQ